VGKGVGKQQDQARNTVKKSKKCITVGKTCCAYNLKHSTAHNGIAGKDGFVSNAVQNRRNTKLNQSPSVHKGKHKPQDHSTD
jgi:hypothetical protein